MATASEKIVSSWHQAVAAIEAMDVSAMIINLALSAVIVLGVLVVVYAVGRVVRLGSGRRSAASAALHKLRTGFPARLISLVVRAGATLLAFGLVARVWGVDLIGGVTAAIGESTVASLLRLVLLLVVGVAAFELSGLAIRRGIARMALAQEDHRRRAQLRTLGPLLLGLTRTLLGVVIGLMALGQIGIDVGPLLAGAGIAGIAVGFGAQTLVKDFLTGAFMLIEDVVSVGDVVRIGDSGGLVEKMTLRTIWLRDFDGTLHVLPYSEAQVIHNMTKIFSCYVFNIQIGYGADIDRAIAVMRAVGAELQADPEFADSILEPIEISGVDALADSGIVLKARFKTLPIRQWAVGRAYNRRIKLAFDRAGIEIPFPHLTVVLPDSTTPAAPSQGA